MATKLDQAGTEFPFSNTSGTGKGCPSPNFNGWEWRIQLGVGPAIIKMEMGVIRRILKRAKRWPDGLGGEGAYPNYAE